MQNSNATLSLGAEIFFAIFNLLKVVEHLTMSIPLNLTRGIRKWGYFWKKIAPGGYNRRFFTKHSIFWNWTFLNKKWHCEAISWSCCMYNTNLKCLGHWLSEYVEKLIPTSLTREKLQNMFIRFWNMAAKVLYFFLLRKAYSRSNFFLEPYLV